MPARSWQVPRPTVSGRILSIRLKTGAVEHGWQLAVEAVRAEALPALVGLRDVGGSVTDDRYPLSSGQHHLGIATFISSEGLYASLGRLQHHRGRVRQL